MAVNPWRTYTTFIACGRVSETSGQCGQIVLSHLTFCFIQDPNTQNRSLCQFIVNVMKEL